VERFPDASSPDRPLTVAVTARDYGWIYSLAGPDGQWKTSDDVISENELHLPRDREVELLVQSEDYVCTFDVPGLQLRKVAVPELVFPVKLRTPSGGKFNVVADPMCGMRYLVEGKPGLVVVEPAADFQSWIDRRSK
jgi:cytochrome c oxidase subunit 2